MPRHGGRFLPQQVRDAPFIKPGLAQRRRHGVTQALERQARGDQRFLLQPGLEAVPDGRKPRRGWV